jgi:hypothetical protein
MPDPATINAEMDASFAQAKSGAMTWHDFHARQIDLHNRIDRAGLRAAWIADFRANVK